MTFLKAGSGVLVAEGRVIGSGQSVVFCEGEVRNDAGELLARAVGTFKIRRRE